MELVTIEIKNAKTVIVHDGRVKKSRLKWTAGNLHIYLLGAITKDNRDMVNWHAQNQCLLRHIPLMQLTTMQVEREKPAAPIQSPFLRSLFDTLTIPYEEDYAFECAMCGKPCQSRDDNGHCSTCRQVWAG